MGALDLYLRCEEIWCDCKRLFNYYERYRGCSSISYLDEEMNNVLRKMALSYAVLMTDVDKDVNIQGNVNNFIIIKADDYIETIGDDNSLFIDQVTNLLQIYKFNILSMLANATEAAKAIYLYNFEKAYSDARQLINRMEMMIRNSQRISQPYLRAIA